MKTNPPPSAAACPPKTPLCKDEEVFVRLAFKSFFRRRYEGRINELNHRRFRATFGTSPRIITILWKVLSKAKKLTNDAREEHLLWALIFLKQYLTEVGMSNTIGEGLNEKTIRKWTRIMVRTIASMESTFIQWERRKAKKN